MSVIARASVIGGLFFLLGTGASTPGLELTAQDTVPGVGVLPFNNGGSFGQDAKDYDALRVGLQQILITELSQNSGLRLVERGHLRTLMAEQDISADRVSPETAVRIGRLVGARYMIIGGFIDWYGDVRLDARIVDTETTEVLDADRALAYCDHVVIYRFTPVSLNRSECDITWLVNGDAVEGKDYDKARLVWLWDVTTAADKRIIEYNAEGVNSRFYEPGPYSKMEEFTWNFMEWYLQAIKP